MDVHNTVSYQVAQLLAPAGLDKDERIIKVIAAVSAHTGIACDELLGRSRMPDVVYARFLCFYMLRMLHEFTKSAIARVWGMDHSNVINGLTQLMTWIEVDKGKRDDVERIMVVLNGNEIKLK